MKDKINKTTTSVKKTTNDIKTAVKNGARLVLAAALVIVAGNAIYTTLPSKHDVTVTSAVLLFSGILIALQGAQLFWKHLANKE